MQLRHFSLSQFGYAESLWCDSPCLWVPHCCLSRSVAIISSCEPFRPGGKKQAGVRSPYSHPSPPIQQHPHPIPPMQWFEEETKLAFFAWIRPSDVQRRIRHKNQNLGSSSMHGHFGNAKHVQQTRGTRSPPTDREEVFMKSPKAQNKKLSATPVRGDRANWCIIHILISEIHERRYVWLHYGGMFPRLLS